MDASTPDRPKLVLILGFRSGTSAITEALSQCGLRLSRDDVLLGPGRGNPRGHFEDLRALSVNEWILEQCGSSWDNPWPVPSFEPTTSQIARVREVSSELVAEGVQLLKEPRLSLTLRWWLAAWQGNVDVAYVHMIRSPREVASSLAHREGLPEVLGQLLWCENLDQSLAVIDRRRSIFLSHRSFMSNPAGALNHVVSQLSDWGWKDLFSNRGSEIVEAELLHRPSRTPSLQIAQDFERVVRELARNPIHMPLDIPVIDGDLRRAGAELSEAWVGGRAREQDHTEQRESAQASLSEVQAAKEWFESQWVGAMEQLKQEQRLLSEVQAAKEWFESQWVGAVEQLKQEHQSLETAASTFQEREDELLTNLLGLRKELEVTQEELTELRQRFPDRVLRRIRDARSG